MDIKAGLRYTIEERVTEEKLAKSMNSGALRVYATPAMIALMESCAKDGAEPLLEEGTTTVGTLVNVRHLSPTAPGMTVRCESELIEVEGRRLLFKVTAWDNEGKIGEGVHERMIVRTGSFMEKVEKKGMAVKGK